MSARLSLLGGSEPRTDARCELSDRGVDHVIRCTEAATTQSLVACAGHGRRAMDLCDRHRAAVAAGRVECRSCAKEAS